MTQLVIDPEFRDLIPPLQPAERAQLRVAIIEAGGARDPILTWQGIIVDGHNRYSICTELGLPFTTQELEFPDRASVKAWMFQHQVGRRNLTPDQATMIAVVHGMQPLGATHRQVVQAKEILAAKQHMNVVLGHKSLATAYNDLMPPKRRPPREPIMPAVKPEPAPFRGFSRGDDDDLDEDVTTAATVEPEPCGRTILVWPDTHAPYHSEEAVGVIMAVAKHIRPSTLVILGDMFDCFSVSRFTKRPKAHSHSIAAELEASQGLIKAIDRLGIPNVFFLQGNHEFRLELYVANNAAHLEGLVPYAKDLIPQTWKYVPYKRSLQIGKGHYSHDFGRAGINAGRQGLLDLGKNLIHGHTHKLGVTYVGQHSSLQCGWLGDVEEIDYQHIDRARVECQLGFGLVDEDAEGNIWSQAIPIVGKPGNFRAVVRGMSFAA